VILNDGSESQDAPTLGIVGARLAQQPVIKANPRLSEVDYSFYERGSLKQVLSGTGLRQRGSPHAHFLPVAGNARHRRHGRPNPKIPRNR
jgi:hypothetical protein